MGEGIALTTCARLPVITNTLLPDSAIKIEENFIKEIRRERDLNTNLGEGDAGFVSIERVYSQRNSYFASNL